METLLIQVDSPAKAKKLSFMLSSMNFVRKVSSIKKREAMITALQEHETLKAAIVKNKNKSIAKYF